MKTVLFLAAILALFNASNQTANKQPFAAENAATVEICLPSIQPTPYSVWIDTCAARYGIPREVILGIAAKESNFGRSYLGRTANNWFGIKDAKYDYWTKGSYTSSKGNVWRKYESPYESIEDFCIFIRTHYSHLVGKSLEKWNIYGCAESPYLAAYFLTFKNKSYAF